ncbi:MAG: Cu(I)-responsive transcriptional regulator [Alphaproteobacteria bacterium]
MIVGQASRATGLPTKTLRYYEEIGLVAPARHENGYRSYTDADVHKLKFLQRARSLGFSIKDCRALLSFYEDKNRTSAEVKSCALAHLDTVERKIAELQSLRATLTHLIDACRGDHLPDCPILDDLSGLDSAA